MLYKCKIKVFYILQLYFLKILKRVHQVNFFDVFNILYTYCIRLIFYQDNTNFATIIRWFCYN